MRKIALLAATAAAFATAVPAAAELQTVTIDGSLTIRMNWYDSLYPSPGGAGSIFGVGVPVGVGLRWPGGFLPARPIGSLAAFGGVNNSIGSTFAWDEDEPNLGFVEQRTRLGFTADFTNEVSTYFEFDYYNTWGTDFRSNYQTGADFFTGSADVQLYQAYVEAREMYGHPLSLRIGRQELTFGSQWLIGTNSIGSFPTGLSFDAIRATYATDMFSVDAFYSILAENSPIEEDEDVTLAGIYASYLGLEDITIDAYWLWLRDARSLNDTNFTAPIEWIEDALGVDDYDPTNIHTFGIRGAGVIGAFDFEAEAAYQTGDVDALGFTFKPFGLYGDDGLDMSEWAANVEVGYTFDMQWTPRVYLGAAYFSGEDNRDTSFWEWISPFDRPEGSTAFNRLFSNWEYSEFIDYAGAAQSNLWIGRGGVSVSPTESVDVLLALSYFETLDAFDAPRYFSFGGFRVPIAPALSFWTQENDTELGWEVGLYVIYDYSEDLQFEVGYAHLFVGDGLADGNFSTGNGFLFNGGSSDDDPNYLYFQTKIAF